MRDGAAWFVAGLGLLIGTVLLVGARNIAPPMFDPVGSAALPRVCAVALIGLCLGVLVQSWRRRTAGAGSQPPAPSTRVATVGVAALMALYLAAMEAGLGFALSTIVCTSLMIPLISRRWRLLPLAIGIALVLGLGAQWLFTSVFFVDLPR